MEMNEDAVQKMTALAKWHFNRTGEKLRITSGMREGDSGSHHGYGEAFDAWSQELEDDAGLRREYESMCDQLGMNFRDEWEDPTDRTTSGHMHANTRTDYTRGTAWTGATQYDGSESDGFNPLTTMAMQESEQNDRWGQSREYLKAVYEQEKKMQLDANENASLADGFTNQWVRSFLGGLSHTSAMKGTGNYIFTQDDEDFVTSHLGGDTHSQEWVYGHANNREQLEQLVNMRLEDKAREKRVEKSDFFSRSTLGSVFGFLGGEALNPMNYIGAGTFKKGSMALRILKAGGINGLVNIADSGLRQRITGYEEDYKFAGLAGMVAGAIPVLGDKLLSKLGDRIADDAIGKVLAKSTEVGENAKHIIEGLLPTNYVKATDGALKAIKGMALKVEQVAPALKQLIADGKALVIDEKDIDNVSRLIGKKIKKGAKVVHLDSLDIFTSKAVAGLDDKAFYKMTRGLKSIPVERLGKVSKWVQKHIDDPKGTWSDAINRIVERGDNVTPASVLGEYANIMKETGHADDWIKTQRLIRQASGEHGLRTNDVVEMLLNNADEASDGVNAFQKISDGSAVVGKTIMSDTNAINPEKVTQLAKTVEDSGKIFGFNIPKPIKNVLDWAKGLGDNSLLTQTYYGLFNNSKMKTLRELGLNLAEDAQQRVENVVDHLVAEKVKQRALQFISKERIELSKGLREELMKLGYNEDNYRSIWKQVVQYHDAKYAGHAKMPDVDDTIKRMAEQLNILEKKEVAFAKELGFLPKDWTPANGTRRVTSPEKWKNFLNDFNAMGNKEGWKQAEDVLEHYAEVSMLAKREGNKAVYMKMLDEEYQKTLTAWQKECKIIQEKIDNYVPSQRLENAKMKYLKDNYPRAGHMQQDMSKMNKWFDGEVAKEMPKLPPKPRPPVFTEDGFRNYIKSEAHSFAFGQLDKGRSFDMINMYRKNAGLPPLKPDTGGGLPWLKQRSIMDTSLEINIDGYGKFSFDDALRDYDFDYILDRTSNRWAGEVALHDAFNNHEMFAKYTGINGQEVSEKLTLENVQTLLEHEGKDLIARGKMSPAQLHKELKGLDDFVSLIRGVGQKDPKTVLDGVTQVLRNFSYMKNGGNFGINQLMEMGGAMGYTGFKQLTSVLPFGREFVQKCILGDDTVKLGNEAIEAMFGVDAKNILWANANLVHSTIGRTIDPLGMSNSLTGRLLGGLDKAVAVGSEVTSTINQLQKLTAVMIHDIRLFAYSDLCKFVNTGKAGSFLRNPVSAHKLAVAGIKDPDAFRKALGAFMNETGQLDLNKMYKANRGLYMQVYEFIDTSAKRAITHDTLGNRNILSDKNWFTRCLFQFKKFTFQATNTQAFRIMNSRERDDFLATAYSAFMTAGMFTGLTYANAYARYGDNKMKRDKYIKTRIGGNNLAWATLMRSSILGSPLSPLNDLSEAGNFGWFSDAGTLRTSVNRDFRRGGSNNDWSDVVGNVVSQLPVMQSVDDIAGAGKAIGNSALNGLNKKDIQRISRLIPANNFFGTQKLLYELVNHVDVPNTNKGNRR